MAAREDEGPDGQHDRLEPQDRSVHHANRVDHVQAEPVKRAEIWDRELRQICDEMARGVREPAELEPVAG